jgi:hypothetical protein
MYYLNGLGGFESGVPKILWDAGVQHTRSRALLEFVFETTNQGAARNAFTSAGVNASMSDEEIINAVCDQYSTKPYWMDAYWNSIMNVKWNGCIRTYYLELEKAELPLFAWDEDEQMFTSEGSLGKTGWSLKNVWKYITNAKADASGKLYYPWSKMFTNSQVQIKQYTTSDGKVINYGTDANMALERHHYKINAVSGEDVDFEIAKIFATIDKVTVSTYLPLTDDFFKLKYQDLFSTALGKKWSTAQAGMNKYLPDGWYSVFDKANTSTNPDETDVDDVKYTLLNEFDRSDSPILKALVVYGAVSADGAAPTKKPISIHSVSKGSVLTIGNDIKYGGTYILVQYENCVIYYGGLDVDSSLSAGSRVEKRQVLGTVLSDSYFYIAM